MRTRCIVAAGLWLLFPSPGLAGSQARVEIAPPGTGDWEPLVFPRIDRHTEYAAVELDGRAAVRAESECAASALVVPVAPDTLDRAPILRWSWQVEEPLDVEDERSRSGDDFAARVYLMFRFEPERAGWFERSRRALAETLYGRELPGNALNYVWSSRVPRGETWKNPYSEEARMLSMGPGPPQRWRDERVDVMADYRGQFGSDPPELLGLAIMTDSDDTCGRATASFADFRFVARAVGEDPP